MKKKQDIQLDWTIEVDVSVIEFVDAFTEFLESRGWFGGGITRCSPTESDTGWVLPLTPDEGEEVDE